MRTSVAPYLTAVTKWNSCPSRVEDYPVNNRIFSCLEQAGRATETSAPVCRRCEYISRLGPPSAAQVLSISPSRRATLPLGLLTNIHLNSAAWAWTCSPPTDFNNFTVSVMTET